MATINVNDIADSFEPVGISQLGTAVYDNITFPAGQYVDLDGNVQVYNEVVMDAVTVNVNRSKEIVVSHVAGRNGTVKEYVTTNDYEIRINAIIAPDLYTREQLQQIAVGFIPGVQETGSALALIPPNEPVQAINDLALLEAVPDRLEIRSKFLQNNFDINFVVIESMDIARFAADSYTVRLQCFSDFEVDLGDFG